MTSILRNLKMNRKIMIVPFIMMLFLIVIASTCYKGLGDQKRALDEIMTVRFATYQEASQLITRITAVNKDVYRLIGQANSGTDAARIEAGGKALLQAIGEAKALIGRITAKPLDGEEKGHLAAVAKELEAYGATVQQVGQMALADAAMALTMMVPVEERFQTLNGRLQALLAYEQQLGQTQHVSAGDTYRLVVRGLVIALGVLLALSLTLNLSVARLITRPLRQTVEVIREIAAGDLTREIRIDTTDEIGELARAVDTMRLKMGEAVGQSAATSQDLSESAARQAASLEETSSSIEEMTSMIKNSAQNAAQTNQLMTASREVIRSADGSITELDASMKKIAAASEQTQKIVKTIDEIAFQTNLLALNAAVEAARAGEAGAGFAVVAEEVRNLAIRAAESARNSSGMIQDIVTKVRQGETLVTVTCGAFRQVTDSSEKVMHLMADIARAADEQAQGIDQINRAVLEMNQVTQDNAASAQELAAAMALFRTGREAPGPAQGRHCGLLPAT